ncbi:MAG: isochorismate synthase [Bacteroidales bacterium]|nr:isochorismate synthase [Bacteroidales bacterium]
MELSAFINQLLANDQAFVCYRLPEAAEPVCLAGGDFEALVNLLDVQNEEGFVLVPFHASAEMPPLFYRGGQSYHGWQNEYPDVINKETPKGIKSKKNEFLSVGFQEYARQANHLVKKMRSGSLQKVVLSRIIAEPLSSSFEAGQFFENLCQKYPAAFIYLLNDGRGQCWAGASPEMLLAAEKGSASTMSLAGTLPAKKGGTSDFEWQDKEKEEQNLVTKFIREKLITSGISDFIEAPLETRPAGPVVHLLKQFSFKMPGSLSALELAKNLHPTPAVCGLPADLALKEILSTEDHQRGYYAGFLGPVSNSQTAQLFVNLRCMQIVEKNAVIFVGGGLLTESEVEREWQETETKAETLLSVIRKLN